MNYTKGRWSLFYNEQGTYSIGANVDTEDQEIIAEVFECDNGKAEANAKLIAAAPDLLEALMDMVSDRENLSQATIDFAKTAIKKATE
jgi:hypothetical protein